MEQLSLDDLEVWRPVPGWEERYQVSSLGRIRSLYRPGVGKTGRMRKPSLAKVGYLLIDFTRPGGRSTWYVHRVVMAAFAGPCPPGQEVRHLDGNPLNNRVWNLAYGTRSQNNLDAVRHGTNPMSAKQKCPQGHFYDEANTKVIPSRPTARYCRACHRECWRGQAA